MRRLCLTTVAVQKQYVLHILRVSVTLVIQHAKRMGHSVLLRVACLAPPYFPTLPHELHGFREDVTEHNLCFHFRYKFV
jgi:hypothetical protein